MNQPALLQHNRIPDLIVFVLDIAPNDDIYVEHIDYINDVVFWTPMYVQVADLLANWHVYYQGAAQ